MADNRNCEEKYNNASCLYNQYLSTGNVEFLRQGLCDIYDVVESTVANEKVMELKRAMDQTFADVVTKKK